MTKTDTKKDTQQIQSANPSESKLNTNRTKRRKQQKPRESDQLI